jgi:hypothetical protein
MEQRRNVQTIGLGCEGWMYRVLWENGGKAEAIGCHERKLPNTQLAIV